MQARGKMQNEDHRHWVKIMQNEEYRLQTRGEMREKTVGNTSALIEVSRNLFKSIYCGQNVCFFFHIPRQSFVEKLFYSSINK